MKSCSHWVFPLSLMQVASKPVHRVAYNRVTFANVFGELQELGPVHVLPRSLISKALVESNSFELTQLLLMALLH